MYSDNASGMLESMNQKRAKYIREQRCNAKQSDNVINLTLSDDNDSSAGIPINAITSSGNSSISKTKVYKSGLAKDADNANSPIFSTVQEDTNRREDEYSKYDPEPDADNFLINSGATIIDSRIEITDSSGRNRVIVRRNTE